MTEYRYTDGGTIDAFYVWFSENLILSGHQWHGNLDALNDILLGGFGVPEGPKTIVWHAHRNTKLRYGVKRFNTLCDILIEGGFTIRFT